MQHQRALLLAGAPSLCKTDRTLKETKLRAEKTTSFSVASVKHLLGEAGEGTSKLESSSVNVAQFVEAPLIVFVCPNQPCTKMQFEPDIIVWICCFVSCFLTIL